MSRSPVGVGLVGLGWKEGGNLRVVWRWGGGDPSLFERYAAELVALGPEVLMANARSSVAALRRETSTIPIVFVNVSSPVEQGFVESVARRDRAPRPRAKNALHYD
jgi:putative ABC transport system substrate-binding protein